MKLFERILVFGMLFFWFVVGIFFTRNYLFAILPVLGLLFIVLGGIRRV
jgi:hypothetical protein